MEKVTCTKLNMSQIWHDDEVVPVTLLKVRDEDSVVFERVREGDAVTISGKSKGRGFQGVVKRHGFSGGPKTHGQKHSHRAPGSIGSTDQARTIPGKKMPGRMGGNRVTVKNLLIARLDAGQNIIMLRGAVPGPCGSTIEIKFITTDGESR